MISGELAQKMYQALMNPPKDPDKEEFIKQAIKLFPKPNEPTVVDIEL